MNVDPRNPVDTPFDAHGVLKQPHQANRQPAELSAHANTPAHRSENQASFEQQLDGLDSVYPASDSVLLAANPGTATSAPNEVATKAGRYAATLFVGAHANLAATPTGATLDAPRNEIDPADQQSARWSLATAAFDERVDRDRIFDDPAGSSYVTLRRFQNHDSDSKPRTEANTGAISHVRNTARDHSSAGDPLERYPMDLCAPGWMAYERQDNSFLSCRQEDPLKLVVSRDHLARAIANMRARCTPTPYRGPRFGRQTTFCAALGSK